MINTILFVKIYFYIIIWYLNFFNYNTILYVNHKLLLKLDSTIRLDSYIGVISIMIAIVIFVAEVINDKRKMEFDKRFVMNFTNVKNNINVSVFILLFYYLKMIINYNYGVSDCDYLGNCFYFIGEIFFNIIIVYSMFNTVELFKNVIKINTDSDYYFKEYKKYIFERLNILNSKYSKNISKKIPNNHIERFVKNNSIYFSFDINYYDPNEYTIVKSKNNGIFQMYSIEKLENVISTIQEFLLKKKESVIGTNPIIILLLNESEILNKSVSIAYIRNDYKDILEELQDTLILQNNVPFQDNELQIMLDSIFYHTFNGDNSFEDFSLIVDFFNYLYKNKMIKIAHLSIDYIGDLLYYHKNPKYLDKIQKIASCLLPTVYLYKDVEYYKILSEIMYYSCKYQISSSKDVRKLIFDYTNSTLRFEYYSVNKADDKTYYDILMSFLLEIIADLLETKNFEAICDIFKNVYFGNNTYFLDFDDELCDNDIIRIQFTFGFIYCLLVLKEYKRFNKMDDIYIDRIVNYIKDNFVNVYDFEDVLFCFINYFNYNSFVREVYKHFDFRFIDKRYKTSWSGYCVNYSLILKDYINLFKIFNSDSNILHDSLISKDKIYDYENLINIFNSKDNNLNDSYQTNRFDNILNKLNLLLDKSKEDKEKYDIVTPINNKTIEKFVDEIINDIYSNNNLISYLKSANKIIFQKKKRKRMFGFNQFIDRNIFFEENSYNFFITESYSNAMIRELSKIYIEGLNKKSIVENTSLEDFVDDIDCNEYVIIASQYNKCICNLIDYENNKVKINDNKIDFIIEPYAKDIYLVNKLNLPKLNFYCINEEDVKKKKNIYYNIIDCSNDEEYRKKIISTTEWIKEIGDEKEQDHYLKSKCVFKLFVSSDVSFDNNDIIHKFLS